MREQKEQGRSGIFAPLAFVLLCHLLFVLIAGLVLLLALPVARVAGSTVGFVLVGAFGLALIVQYQRIAGIARRIVGGLGFAQAQAGLPESYVAALAICHFAPLLVLLYAIDGSWWLHRQQVVHLTSVEELVQHRPEGVFRIDRVRAVAWLGYRRFQDSLGNANKTYANRDQGTTWRVMPLTSGSADREQLEAGIAAGRHCVWLGSKGADSPTQAEPSGSDRSPYFIERDTRDARKYLAILASRVAQPDLPACTRILQESAAPEQQQADYLRLSAVAVSLAHGIPALLMLILAWYSGAGPRVGSRQTKTPPGKRE